MHMLVLSVSATCYDLNTIYVRRKTPAITNVHCASKAAVSPEVGSCLLELNALDSVNTSPSKHASLGDRA